MKNIIQLRPANLVNGEILLPGSKSISNRVLLLSSQAKGITYIKNLLISQDTVCMLKILNLLGVNYFLSKNQKNCRIVGIGQHLYSSKEIFFTQDSGITMRFLIAVFSLNKCPVFLHGNKRMQERPIKDLVDALRMGGAKIEYISNHGYPPVKVSGVFQGGDIILSGKVSSQFLSALIMIAPFAPKDTKIYVKDYLTSYNYIGLTLSIMRQFGIEVYHENYNFFHIKGNSQYISPKIYNIEGDISSASYFLAASAIKGGTVRVLGVGKKSIQGETNFIKILKDMGAIIKVGKNYIECTKSNLNPICIDVNDVPDTSMTALIVALFVKNGTTKFFNFYNWRFKESNRLTVIINELRKLGAKIRLNKNYLEIFPLNKVISYTLDTCNDHRFAMCFALISLFSKNVITIKNVRCVKKTFPSFFKKFNLIVKN